MNLYSQAFERRAEKEMTNIIDWFIVDNGLAPPHMASLPYFLGRGAKDVDYYEVAFDGLKAYLLDVKKAHILLHGLEPEGAGELTRLEDIRRLLMEKTLALEG